MLPIKFDDYQDVNWDKELEFLLEVLALEKLETDIDDLQYMTA